jgi:hypothetical protein
MAGLRHVGALGRLIIWHPIGPIFFKIFRVGDGWQILGQGGMPRLWRIFGGSFLHMET